ncbi:MAG: ATP-binding protein, partial [Candidatus Paceibacterota bacterium]
MPKFSANLANDASAVIRGFNYQIHITIDRWLDLEEGEILELERGEDIDLIASNLKEGENGVDRTLEQVKSLKENVTLNNNKIKKFLIDSFIHYTENEEIDLKFLFTTTAKIGREKPPIYENAPPALKKWKSLRGKVTDETLNFMKNLNEALLALTKPTHCSQEDWQKFKNFLDSKDLRDQLNFFSKFEWSTSQSKLDIKTNELQQEIVKNDLKETDEGAKQLFEKIFFYVIKKLSEKGLKRLSLDQLEKLASSPSLNELDKKISSAITRMKSNEDRIDTLEERFSSKLLQLEELLNQISTEFKNPIKFQGIWAEVDSTVPKMSDPYSNRKKLVKKLTKKIEDNTVLAIDGEFGIGKTTLANLIARSYRQEKEETIWISLKDLSATKSFAKIEILARKYISNNFSQKLFGRGVIKEFCNKLADNTLLIVDDLPAIDENVEFRSFLENFVAICERENISLLMTLANKISRFIDKPIENMVEVTCPPFSDNEARELLLSYKPPENFLEKNRVTFINEWASGHPVLLQAILRFLERNNWDMEKASKGFLEQDYVGKINEKTLNKILNSIEDENVRKLLGRLNLIQDSFTFEKVQRLADIEPKISVPRIKFNRLKGLWVQKQSEDEFKVSSLVKKIGDGLLNLEESKNCHAVLAEEILDKSPINMQEGVQALTHFYEADEFEKAGLVLLQALREIYSYPQEELSQLKSNYPLIISIWKDKDLPEAISEVLELLIRSYQVGVYERIGKDFDSLAENMKNKLKRCDLQQSPELIIPSLIALTVGKKAFSNDMDLFLSKLEDVLNSKDALKEIDRKLEQQLSS